jgi:hypothetical protein
LFHILPIQNGLKQRDSSSHLFDFVSEYAIKNVQESHVRMKLSGTHKLLVHADNINLCGDDRNTKKKNREAQIYDSKKVRLKVNTKKSQVYVVL